MTLGTVPEATRVIRIDGNGPPRALEPPVWVDCDIADAIYADGFDVVVEHELKVWRFQTPSTAIADKRAKELASFANLRRSTPR